MNSWQNVLIIEKLYNLAAFSPHLQKKKWIARQLHMHTQAGAWNTHAHTHTKTQKCHKSGFIKSVSPKKQWKNAMKRNKEITTYQRTWKKKKQRLSFSCSFVVALACVVERGSCVVRIQRQRMSAFLSVPFLALCLSSQVSPCSPAKKKQSCTRSFTHKQKYCQATQKKLRL